MKRKELTALSPEELSKELGRLKANKVIDALVIGFCFGIIIYSAIEKGFSFFTFFPLLVVILIARNSRNNLIAEKEMKEELRSRDFLQ